MNNIAQSFNLTYKHPLLSCNNIVRLEATLMSYTNCQTPPLTTFAGSLKQYTNLSFNQVTPPVSTSVNPPTLAPAALTILYC